MYSKTRVRVYMYHTMKHIGLKTGTKTLKPKKVIKKDLGFIWSDWDTRPCIPKLKYSATPRNWNSIIKIAENTVQHVLDHFIILKSFIGTFNWQFWNVQSLKLTAKGPGLQLKTILEVTLAAGLDGQGDPWSYRRTILLDTGSSCGRVLALPKLWKTQYKRVF